MTSFANMSLEERTKEYQAFGQLAQSQREMAALRAQGAVRIGVCVDSVQYPVALIGYRRTLAGWEYKSGNQCWIRCGEGSWRLVVRDGRALLDAAKDSGSGSTEQGVAIGRQEQPVEPRPVRLCACGQEIREPVGGWVYGFPFKYCGDCRGAMARGTLRQDLDRRIAAARVDVDPASDWSAWSTPHGEGP